MYIASTLIFIRLIFFTWHSSQSSPKFVEVAFICKFILSEITDQSLQPSPINMPRRIVTDNFPSSIRLSQVTIHHVFPFLHFHHKFSLISPYYRLASRFKVMSTSFIKVQQMMILIGLFPKYVSPSLVKIRVFYSSI